MNGGYGGGGGGEELLGNLIALMVVGTIFVVAIGIAVFVAYKMSEAIKALPEQHQALPPWAPWLLLIPCANVVLNFWVFTQVPRSYESYFTARGDQGDASLFGIGLMYSILAVLSVIPYIGACFGLANLVLLIVFIVKLGTLKRRIHEPAVGPGIPQTF